VSDNRRFDTSIIEAVKVEHDYGTIMVPESDQNRSENRTLIASESLTLTVTNVHGAEKMALEDIHYMVIYLI
jgi:hypothetical protein